MGQGDAGAGWKRPEMGSRSGVERDTSYCTQNTSGERYSDFPTFL